MHVILSGTGDFVRVQVLPVEDGDYRRLTKKRFFFDWKAERGYEVYKLVTRGSGNILGLVSIDQIPNEWRIHIRLLAVSRENIGKNKEFHGIAGCLLAFVSKLALRNHGELACVSLKPKTALVKHYMQEFGMNRTGMTLSLEFQGILDLLKKHDEE